MIADFVLDDAAEKLIGEGRANRKFRFHHDDFRSDTEKVIKIAIACADSDLRDMYAASGLGIIEPVCSVKWWRRRAVYETECGAGQKTIMSAAGIKRGL